MKLILVILFLGCASASFQDVFKQASDEVVENFMLGMAQAPPLHLALGIDDNDIVKRLQTDVQEELAKYLRDAFDRILKKIDDAFKKGKPVNKEAWDKLKDLKDKMNELKIEDHEVDKFKEQLDDHLRQILDKMGIFDKRSIDEPMQTVFEDLNFRNFILKLKEMILEKMDVASLKTSLAKVVGQASEKLCEFLTNKGKEKVLNFFDRVLDKDDEETKKRSVSDLCEQTKDYFHLLDLDFKQKFSIFGEWVRNVVEKGLDKSKTKIENVRIIARELLDKTKEVSKEVAAEALEFLHQYKEELGHLYDEVYNKLMYKTLDNTH